MTIVVEISHTTYMTKMIFPLQFVHFVGGQEPLILEEKDNMMKRYRIRKITPKESFRLMNFDDEDFYLAESVSSDTQLYKIAGNSICVSCLCAIFSQLGIKGITPWNEMSEDEKKELTKVNRCENPGYERNQL